MIGLADGDSGHARGPRLLQTHIHAATHRHLPKAPMRVEHGERRSFVNDFDGGVWHDVAGFDLAQVLGDADDAVTVVADEIGLRRAIRRQCAPRQRAFQPRQKWMRWFRSRTLEKRLALFFRSAGNPRADYLYLLCGQRIARRHSLTDDFVAAAHLQQQVRLVGIARIDEQETGPLLTGDADDAPSKVALQ